VASKSFHASCVKGTEAQRPPTVAGVDAAPPAPAALPETGTSTTTEWGLLAGLALVGAGGVLLLSRRVGRG
jgi:LPXTG-motif cell wall-anchored protein